MLSAESSLVHLEGTTLEGGGQLLRLALSLSSLTHVPVHIANIRGNRGSKSNPSKGGGLKPAHLAGTQWLGKVTAAETRGVEVRSREMTFHPSRKARNTRGENIQDDAKLLTNEQSTITTEVWKEVYEAGRLVRRDSRITMSTPGSIFLVLQAILPFILFSAPYAPIESSTATSADASIPVRITIEGGTNVTNSPSFEYIDQVLLPMLSAKVGLPPIGMNLHSRGWCHGRSEVGSVAVDITPLKPGCSLPAFSFTGRGEVIKIHVSILASGLATRSVIRDKVTEQVLKRHNQIEILFPVDEDSRDSRRLYLLLVAETSSGYRLGRDWLYDRKTSSPTAVDDLVSRVVDDLELELAHGGCVDEFLQDQLVVFQVLAEGRGLINLGKIKEASLHTRTVRWVAEKMIGVGFDDAGTCAGIAYKVGERYWERTGRKDGQINQQH
ncbi:hypothetical protein MMC07_000804 [Pseudocyphellaria aurata]|nr:hypothetical protein [Pseudocyphellaria aurata]